MIDSLKYKEESIVSIYNKIIVELGNDYFENIDFWDADNCAIGLKKNRKLSIYLLGILETLMTI